MVGVMSERQEPSTRDALLEAAEACLRQLGYTLAHERETLAASKRPV
jgi:hypothetical protein